MVLELSLTKEVKMSQSQLMPKLWRDKGTVSVLTFVPGQSLIHPILEPPRQVTTMRTRKIPRVSSEYKVANVT